MSWAASCKPLGFGFGYRMGQEEPRTQTIVLLSVNLASEMESVLRLTG